MRTFFALILSLLSLPSLAQEGGVEMADLFRESGKIYVVIAVMVIILIGIVVYLTALDKRVRSMEKEVNDRTS